jgi:Mce-associated membrane protein
VGGHDDPADTELIDSQWRNPMQPGRRMSKVAADADPAEQLSDAENRVRQGFTSLLLPIVVGLLLVVALGGLGGWLGYRAYHAYHAQQQRDLFLQVGRQAAVNLTTIDHTRADADVQRILDSATGAFHDDFRKRAPAFVEVVKQAQSKSEGTVTAAGVETETADQAQVLVAVSVRTSNAGAPSDGPDESLRETRRGAPLSLPHSARLSNCARIASAASGLDAASCCR